MAKKETNILYTTLSTLPRDLLSENTYFWNNEDKKELYSGISQLEAGAKHILSNYSIDKIVVVGSEETFRDDDGEYMHVENLQGMTFDNVSFSEKNDALRFFVYRIALFLNGQEDMRDGVIHADAETANGSSFAVPFNSKPTGLVFVKQEKQTQKNINDIIRTIKECSGSKKINLYIDMQGGNRTSGYVNNAVFSMLHYDNKAFDFSIKKVVATNFTPGKKLHEVVDETKQYFINRLVIGMNEFLYYGKATSLDAYIKTTDAENVQVRNIVGIMTEIDKWLSVCSTDKLIENIRKLKEACGEYSYQNDIFDIVVKRISDDYQKMFDTVDENYSQFVVELIRWTLGKRFYQQALTIFEAKIPFVLVEQKICFYADSKYGMDNALEYFIKKYDEASKGKKWMFNDINFWYIKSCITDQADDRLESRYIKTNDPNDLRGGYKDINKIRNHVNHANGADNDPQSIKTKITNYLRNIEKIIKNTTGTNDFMITQELFNKERNEKR